MDRRLLRYYNRELQHLRGTAGEFAREFPKIASRLSLDEFACGDPYVERLLEGFAFLAARVQLKLDAEFPQFTQSILETVYPHYLSPTPSAAIVEFRGPIMEHMHTRPNVPSVAMCMEQMDPICMKGDVPNARKGLRG